MPQQSQRHSEDQLEHLEEEQEHEEFDDDSDVDGGEEEDDEDDEYSKIERLIEKKAAK